MIHILVVDDDPGLLEISRIFLERADDTEVRTAGSAEAALRMLETGKCDCIVSDYEMPDMNGIELLRAVRCQGYNTPFIIFTGRGREDVVIDAINSGADFYVQKGGPPEAQFAELIHKIRQAVKRLRAEEHIKESHEMFKTLNECTSIGVYLIQDGIYLYTNPVFAEIMGYKPGEMDNRLSPADTTCPEDYPLVSSNIRRRIEGDVKSLKFRYRAQRKDGNLFNAEVHGSQTTYRGRPAVIGSLVRIDDKEPEPEKPTINDYIWMMSSPEKVSSVNKACSCFTGIKPRELKGCNLHDIFDTDTARKFTEKNRKIFRDGDTFREILEGTDHEGRDHTLAITRYPIYGEKNRVSSVICAATGITASKEAEESLIQSKETYRSLYSLARLICDNMPDMIWAKNCENRFIFANKATCNGLLNATSTDETIGKTDLFFAERERERHPENPEWHTFGEICQETDKIVMRTGKPGRFDEYGNVQGRFLRLDVHKAPFFNEIGQIIGTVGCGRDVTAERIVEDALKKSEERLRLAVEGAGLGTWNWDVRADRLIFGNHWDRILGYEKEISIYTMDEWVALIHPEDSSWVTEIINEHLDGNTANFKIKYRVRCRNGNWKSVLDSGSVIERDSAGKPLRAAGIILDISRQNEAEKDLQRTEATTLSEVNSRLNLLSSITRHDILNQVTILSGYIELLKEETRENPEAQEYIEGLSKASLTIRDQILFTRDYQEMGVKAPLWQNLSQIIEDEKRVSGMDLIIQDRTHGLEVFADPLLPKVFFNLFENASRHGLDVKRIQISLNKIDEKGIIVFQDDGAGVPEDKKGLIFERGYGSNTGFGLFLSRKILSLTGIRISECGIPGRGARFEMIVPEGGYRFRASEK